MNIETRTENLEHTVFGNGTPGLKTDVAILKKDFSKMGDVEARLVRMERLIWGAIGAFTLLKFLH